MAMARKTWIVDIEIAGSWTEADGEALLTALEPYGVSAVSVKKDRAGVSIPVTAPTMLAAAERGRRIVQAAVPHAAHVVRLTVMTEIEFALEAERSTIPKLVGVTEVAGLLKVSRQRVSALAKTEYFPAPLARLSSGPVWDRTSLTHFLEAWDRTPRRKPGRPKKTAASMIRDRLPIALAVRSR